MTVRTCIPWPDKRLRTKAEPVEEITELRSKMRAAGAGFKVTKNRLTRLALKDTKFEGLSDLFTGPTAIAYSDDPVAAAKVSVDEHHTMACIGEHKCGVGRHNRLADAAFSRGHSDHVVG